ncbi:hypothetical protein [Tunicatimonas pelagia]|uniref:hypothetical protein n=1 Tax=Tunicatimonas pelagia TaxID=931531 RepID=UPI002666A5FC|nr:hypothetical protein [Tunicatimonas pelagia]WKN40576.1 hypothetical protein P0M28_16170 [Tunicatimonas pelagia]
MKTKLFYSSLLIIALIVSLVSCQEEEVSTTDQDTDAQPVQEAHEVALALVELGDAPATDEGAKAYQEGFDNLNFEELNAFYKVLYERSLAGALAENDLSEQATIERWYTRRLEENQQAMDLFELSANHLNEKQWDDLISKQKKDATNGKNATIDAPDDCPFVRFDLNARSTNRSGTFFIRSTNNMFVQNDRPAPGEEPDCDCQIAFPTVDRNYQFVHGTSNRMKNLLDRTDFRGFGGSVLRRIVPSGPSRGTYILIGAGRAGLGIALGNDQTGANYTSCQQVADDLVLSRLRSQ